MYIKQQVFEGNSPNSSDMVFVADCAMSVSSLLMVEMMEEAGDDRSESRSDRDLKQTSNNTYHS